MVTCNGGSYCCAQYVIKFNGRECNAPITRSVGGYQYSYKQPAVDDDVTIEGICNHVPAGHVTVSVSLRKCCKSYRCEDPANKVVTGFPDVSRIEIFEL